MRPTSYEPRRLLGQEISATIFGPVDLILERPENDPAAHLRLAMRLTNRYPADLLAFLHVVEGGVQKTVAIDNLGGSYHPLLRDHPDPDEVSAYGTAVLVRPRTEATFSVFLDPITNPNVSSIDLTVSLKFYMPAVRNEYQVEEPQLRGIRMALFR
jgi:hypothetical protein